MSTLILIIHVIVCFILIFAILLQSGKSADLAGAFGGAGSATAFGPRGSATLMSKITTASAVLFMFTSMGLWIMSTRGAKSVVRGETVPQTQTAPAATPAPKKEEPKAPATETPAQTQQQAPATEPKK